MGSNTEFGALSLLNVHVVKPGGDRYLVGQDARVRFALVNNGRVDDALTRVTSEYARAMSIRWDRGCDGTAEQVDRLPITASGRVPAPSGVRGQRHPAYFLQLTGFTREVLPGTTVPVTFTFDHAGTVTVQVMVQGRQPQDEPADLPCVSPSRP